MKKLFLLCLCLITVLSFKAQENVSWTALYKASSATEGEILISASIAKGWHIYSQRPSDVGPISTTFFFAPGKTYTLVGKTEEKNAEEIYDKTLDGKVFSFTDTAEFSQKIKLKKGATAATFKVEYVCCNDATCFPPKTIELSVKLK